MSRLVFALGSLSGENGTKKCYDPKLAQVVRDTGWLLMEALAGHRSIRSALQLIRRRMGAGCQMNRRSKHPNAGQLLEREAVEWALSW